MIDIRDTVIDKKGDEKRPPWRSVSVSTLPKPDKAAQIKAKLLSASRRLRTGKLHVAVQTNVTNKTMKDAEIERQNDLISLKDCSVSTDFSYIKIKNVSNKYILQHSVSQMTSPFLKDDASCQTDIPSFDCLDLDISKVELPTALSSDRNFLSQKHLKINSLNSIRKTSESWPVILQETPNSLEKSLASPEPGKSDEESKLSKSEYQLSSFLASLDKLVEESNNLVDLLQKPITSKFKEKFKEVVAPSVVIQDIFESLELPSSLWLSIVEEGELQVNNLM